MKIVEVFYDEKPIKTASEISRIDFLFVTLFYCLYDICIDKSKYWLSNI